MQMDLLTSCICPFSCLGELANGSWVRAYAMILPPFSTLQRLTISHASFFASNATAHPDMGVVGVLKGNRAWFHWVISVFTSHHIDNDEVEIALMCILFNTESCKVKRQERNKVVFLSKPEIKCTLHVHT